MSQIVHFGETYSVCAVDIQHGLVLVESDNVVWDYKTRHHLK